MYIQRLLHETLHDARASFAAVLITGQRQSGKKADIFFWRSHDGLEVDSLIQMREKYIR